MFKNDWQAAAYEEECLAAERELAQLKGFVNIEQMLIGSPSGAYPGFVSGLAPIPAWRRDWNAAGALMAEHNVVGWIKNMASGDGFRISEPTRGIEETVFHAYHPNKEAALRAAIVVAVSEQLRYKPRYKVAPEMEIDTPGRRGPLP